MRGAARPHRVEARHRALGAGGGRIDADGLDARGKRWAVFRGDHASPRRSSYGRAGRGAEARAQRTPDHAAHNRPRISVATRAHHRAPAVTAAAQVARLPTRGAGRDLAQCCRRCARSRAPSFPFPIHPPRASPSPLSPLPAAVAAPTLSVTPPSMAPPMHRRPMPRSCRGCATRSTSPTCPWPSRPRRCSAPAPAKVCDTCHGLSRSRLRRSGIEYTDCAPRTRAWPTPRRRPRPRPLEILDCMRGKPGQPFVAAAAGIYTTAAGLPWFEYVFRLAYGPTWQAEYERVPRPGGRCRAAATPFTQGQFDLVAEWFARGLPHLDDVIAGGSAAAAVRRRHPARGRHARRGDGHDRLGRAQPRRRHAHARLRQRATNPRDCLTTYPRASERDLGPRAGTPWRRPPTIRLLRENTYASSYWTAQLRRRPLRVARRLVGRAGATVIDLAAGPRDPRRRASTTPASSPTTRASSSRARAAASVEQSAARPARRRTSRSPSPSAPACRASACTSTSARCSAATTGPCTASSSSDDGGHGLTHVTNPSATSTRRPRQRLVPMIYDGQRYVASLDRHDRRRRTRATP